MSPVKFREAIRTAWLDGGAERLNAMPEADRVKFMQWFVNAGSR